MSESHRPCLVQCRVLAHVPGAGRMRRLWFVATRPGLHLQHLDIFLYARLCAFVHQQQARGDSMHKYVARIAPRVNNSAPT